MVVARRDHDRWAAGGGQAARSRRSDQPVSPGRLMSRSTSHGRRPGLEPGDPSSDESDLGHDVVRAPAGGGPAIERSASSSSTSRIVRRRHRAPSGLPARSTTRSAPVLVGRGTADGRRAPLASASRRGPREELVAEAQPGDGDAREPAAGHRVGWRRSPAGARARCVAMVWRASKSPGVGSSCLDDAPTVQEGTGGPAVVKAPQGCGVDAQVSGACGRSPGTRSRRRAPRRSGRRSAPSGSAAASFVGAG